MAGRAILVSAILVFLGLVIFMTSPSEANRRSRNRNFVDETQENGKTEGQHRKGKLFSLFNVVTFNNEPCASTSTRNGITRNGTCYTSTECDDKNGEAEGNCAAGFGVCCIFTIDGTDGQTTVDYNCTYIQNEDYPNAVTGASTNTFTINKCNDDVCFLRLDFVTFSLVGTSGSGNNDEGVCADDTFTVNTSTRQVIPTICGLNTGQHMYIDIGADSGDSADLAITTSNMAANRNWDIKVTQVECNNRNAPRDASCLQYHTGLTGRLTTFNYDNPNDNHLNNQQYSICIRPEVGFCCVEYRVCEDQLTPIAGNAVIKAGFSFDTSRQDARNDGGCRSNVNSFDYIAITASGATCAKASGDGDRGVNSRYCGGFLNQVKLAGFSTPICDCTQPFQVDVFFNNLADGQSNPNNANTKQSRGFCLDYRQIAC